jgi:hypothetical protein
MHRCVIYIYTYTMYNTVVYDVYTRFDRTRNNIIHPTAVRACDRMMPVHFSQSRVKVFCVNEQYLQASLSYPSTWMGLRGVNVHREPLNKKYDFIHMNFFKN